MDKQYPKYQWSTFLKGNRDEQIVLRTDDWHEFLGEVKKIKEALAKQEPQTKDVYERYQDSQPESKTCPEHNVPIYKREGKYGIYYSHKQGDEWCNKKPKELS